MLLLLFVVRGQSAKSTGIKLHVNRVSKILLSSANANWILVKKPMNLTPIYWDKSKCVKISRLKREIHASPKNLFTRAFEPDQRPLFEKDALKDMPCSRRISGSGHAVLILPADS
ncbi:MAG: hypothetical protein ABSF34_05530 [Verrucomicrobiota bacterium]